jgi:general secretion pathway protein C
MEPRDRLIKYLVSLPISRISQGMFGLLLILCCQQLATLTWQLLPAAKGPQQPLVRPPQGGVGRAPETNPLDVRGLLQLALFGKAEAPAAEKSVTTEVKQNAPRTRLNLTLTGVLASDEARHSIAIIINGGDESGYGIGDTITGTQAKVHSILPDRVILDNQGQDETLMLDGEEFKAAGASTPTMPAPAPAAQLTQLRDDLVKNPGKLLDYINISPVMSENKLQGYRINPGKDVAFFHRIGLQSNDLAVSINGYDLRNNGQAMQIMNQLSSMTEMNLTVERNGQQQDIYIKLTE